MRLRPLIVLSCVATFACAAHAEIYKQVDANGHVTYSSTPIKGGKKLYLEPLPTMAPVNNADTSFRIDPATQRKRDDARRRILQDELSTEQKALEEARAKLQAGKDDPEVYRTAGGKTLRNVDKYDEKVNALQDDVTSHEKNIEALQTELSNLK